MKSLKNPNTDNMGGNTRLFLADINEITAFPFSVDAFTGNITFSALKGFYEFDCAQQSIDADIQEDGNFFNHQIKCEVPNVNIERDQILNVWQNTKFIVLRKDSNGNYLIHGHINYPLKLTKWKRVEKGNFSSLKSYQLEISSTPVIPISAIPYTGLVTIAY